MVFHSRGAGLNNDYSQGLRVLLERLRRMNVKILRVAVASRDTRALPLEHRTLQLPGTPYPIEVGDAAKLQGEAQLTVAEGKDAEVLVFELTEH